MSAIDDPWAKAPTPPASLTPPRPDVRTYAAPASLTTSAQGSFARSESWQRVGGILGIVWAFFFLLTIPGWLALGHYKKWKRGEIDTPYGLIWWGYAFSAVVVIVLVSSAGS
jgi:hypothetical protein